MLGGVGSAKLWSLINSKQIESYVDGRARMIVVASIEAYIARQVAAALDEDGHIKHYERNPAPAPVVDAGSAKARRKRHRTNSEQPPARPP
jgi:hypothetical protein